ncbi:MAG: hypothetical protein HRU75_00570 [Planctomycetia bacterium]|nr:MAG: hypothetical protein HRU75_00570 [Planctomycetia bacterium]
MAGRGAICRILTLLAAALVSSGCGAFSLRLFPPQLGAESLEGGEVELRYDLNRDGRPDFAERHAADSQVHHIRFDVQNGGAALPWPTGGDVTDLIIIVDSIPFEVVEQAWNSGRLRLFAPPSRTIAPFPAVTDPAINDLLGCGRALGVEAMYYANGAPSAALREYSNWSNSPWARVMNYRLWAPAHGLAYLDPGTWLLHELGRVQAGFHERHESGDARPYLAYLVGGSSIGARYARKGHEYALDLLDRMCRAVIHRAHGRVRITLMSDHGHTYEDPVRVRLSEALRVAGFHPVSRIRGPRDVFIPEWGMISCASIYTSAPVEAAAAAARLEGVELTLARDPSEAAARLVFAGEASARIECLDDGWFRYQTSQGDPLQLAPQWAELCAAGKARADGAIHDSVLFEALARHRFPDSLMRLCRADDLFAHPPDVYVSLSPGHFSGETTFRAVVGLNATHGSIRDDSSCGFVMTTAGALPPVLRNADVGAALRRAGVHTPDCGASE